MGDQAQEKLKRNMVTAMAMVEPTVTSKVEMALQSSFELRQEV